MSAREDRIAWLEHLHECPLCPVTICGRGWKLAAAVRESMAAEETRDWT